MFMLEATGGPAMKVNVAKKGGWLNRNIRWLLVGGGASALGDQLTLVALPWLVMSITSESWALGMVIGLVGIPKALFVLFGGVFVDRFSPKRVMLVSKWVNATVLSILALLVYSQQLTVTYLCTLSFFFGVSEAFSSPARSSILPMLVERCDFEKVNSVFMLVGQMMLVAGPLVAGVFLGISDAQGASYLYILFSFDALTYVFSALTLSFVVSCPPKGAASPKGMLASLRRGAVVFWSDITLRTLTLYVAFSSCIVGGAVQIGLPLLVKNVWNEGGESYSYLLSFGGFGAAVGVVVGARKPKFMAFSLGDSYSLVYCFAGVFITLLGLLGSIILAYPLFFFISLLAGYFQVGLISWIQRRVSVEALGRTMSIVMFTTLGLVPLSAAIFGVFIDYFSVDHVVIASGISLLCVAVSGMKSPALRSA